MPAIPGNFLQTLTRQAPKGSKLLDGKPHTIWIDLNASLLSQIIALVDPAKQREFKAAKVPPLIEDMKHGRWKPMTDSWGIGVVNNHAYLMNGQHRAAAMKQADLYFTTPITIQKFDDLAEMHAHFYAMDRGTTRNTRDIGHITGLNEQLSEKRHISPYFAALGVIRKQLQHTGVDADPMTLEQSFQTYKSALDDYLQVADIKVLYSKKELAKPRMSDRPPGAANLVFLAERLFNLSFMSVFLVLMKINRKLAIDILTKLVRSAETNTIDEKVSGIYHVVMDASRKLGAGATRQAATRDLVREICIYRDGNADILQKHDEEDRVTSLWKSLRHVAK